MRIKEIYRGNTPPRDTDSVWIRGKEILLFTNEGWVNVNESTVVDTELNPESNHPIANSAVATSLSNAEENLSETSENLIKNKAVYNQYITQDEIKEVCEIAYPGYEEAKYRKQYFTIENISNTSILMTWTGTPINTYYSLNNGATWTSFSSHTLTIPVGGKALFKHSGSSDSYEGKSGKQLQMNSGNAKIYGNIMSLLYGDNFKDANSLGTTKQFRLLFWQNSRIADASNLIIPATTLTLNCYDGMFEQCTGLSTPPKTLPATIAAANCYYRMFYGCTALTSVPKIALTTLASSCCRDMFNGCTKITTGPDLLAETGVMDAYRGMFENCNALTSIKCLLTSSVNDTEYMMLNVQNVQGLTRTLYKHPNATFWPGSSYSLGHATWTFVNTTI